VLVVAGAAGAGDLPDVGDLKVLKFLIHHSMIFFSKITLQLILM